MPCGVPSTVAGVPLRMRPVHAGMHAVVDVEGVTRSAFTPKAVAGRRDHAVVGLLLGRRASPNALLLGFGSVRPALIEQA